MEFELFMWLSILTVGLLHHKAFEEQELPRKWISKATAPSHVTSYFVVRTYTEYIAVQRTSASILAVKYAPSIFTFIFLFPF